MPIFNKTSYNKFSDIIASSNEYLKSFDQDVEYMTLRKNILEKAIEYDKKDKNFLELIWLKRTKQGIANTTSNGFNSEEFEENLDSLHDLTKEIKKRKDHETYKTAIATLVSWKKNRMIKNVYKAQVARAFATFYPDDFVNWVTDEKIRKVLKVFAKFDDLPLHNVNRTSDWYTISSQIRSAINQVNVGLKNKLNAENLRWLISQVYLQNSEDNPELFDKNVDKYRELYQKKVKEMKCPEGNLEPDVVYESGVFRIIRCSKVKAWVLANAKGRCENCYSKAPFKDAKGFPYLEVHHMKHLADKGSDTPSNTVALCPNCHRAIHFSEKKEAIIKRIYSRVKRLEK